MITPPSSPQAPLLAVENLKTYFYTPEGTLPAVNGIDFSLSAGEAFGLVGESGCEKSVIALWDVSSTPAAPTGKQSPVAMNRVYANLTLDTG